MGAHRVEDLLVALLRHDAIRRVAVAAAKAEELFKRIFEVQFSAPAEALCKRHGYRVAVVDLGEHEAVGGIDHVAAEHAREAVERQHRALARAAAGDDVIRRAGVEQNRGENAVLHIGQLAFAFLAVHAVVIDLMTHRSDNLLERGLDRRVFRRLTVFVDQRNPHK